MANLETLDISSHIPDKGLGEKVDGFVPEAVRWRVERTIAWLTDCRRAASSFERKVSASLDEMTLAALSEDERTRCGKYRRHLDRLRFAATRAAKRGLLAQRLALAPQDIRFSIGARSKPQLAGGAPFFNISHAGCHALIAISDTVPVGVDLERVDATRPLADLAEQLFTPDERAHCANSATAFYELWTGKEAVLKAWGWGIAVHLPALSLLPANDNQDDPEFALALRGLPEPATQAWRLAAPGGYAAALALGSTAAPFSILS